MMKLPSSSRNCNYALQDTNYSSERISVSVRPSLLIGMDDGSCYDLTNLSLKANPPRCKDLYPQKQEMRLLPDIEEPHTLRLWQPLPRATPTFQRLNTTTTCTQNEHKRRPELSTAISCPLSSPARPPRPLQEPGPRPKINYRKVYGDGCTDPAMEKKRHISFQERQLQRFQQEEEEEKLEHIHPPLSVHKPTLVPCKPAPTIQAAPQTVMEIAPNLFVPYRGSQESWEAVQQGKFTVATCFACTLNLVVIDTAEYLVCPDCDTVSPLSYNGSHGVQRSGVGLGIKREWCCAAEDDEVTKQHPTQPSSWCQLRNRPVAAKQPNCNAANESWGTAERRTSFVLQLACLP